MRNFHKTMRRGRIVRSEKHRYPFDHTPSYNGDPWSTTCLRERFFSPRVAGVEFDDDPEHVFSLGADPNNKSQQLYAPECAVLVDLFDDNLVQHPLTDPVCGPLFAESALLSQLATGKYPVGANRLADLIGPDGNPYAVPVYFFNPLAPIGKRGDNRWTNLELSLHALMDGAMKRPESMGGRGTPTVEWENGTQASLGLDYDNETNNPGYVVLWRCGVKRYDPGTANKVHVRGPKNQIVVVRLSTAQRLLNLMLAYPFYPDRMLGRPPADPERVDRGFIAFWRNNPLAVVKLAFTDPPGLKEGRRELYKRQAEERAAARLAAEQTARAAAEPHTAEAPAEGAQAEGEEQDQTDEAASGEEVEAETSTD